MPNVDQVILSNYLSLLTSIGLLYLYYQQQKILKLNQLPSVEVSSIDTSGDEITLSIANYGGGLAKNLRIKTTIDFTQENKEAIKVEQRLNRVSECGEISKERAIRSEQRDVRFRGFPGFGFTEEKVYGRFSTGIYEAITKENIRNFNLRIELCYSNQLNEESKIRILEHDRFIKIDEEEIELVKSGQEPYTLEKALKFAGIVPKIDDSLFERQIQKLKSKCK